MKKVIILVLVLVVLAGGGYVYVSGKLSPNALPAGVVEAEQAIMLPSTIGVAAVDLDYVKRVDSFVNGVDDPSPLLNPGIKKTMLGRLKANGTDIIADTSYALAAFGVTDKGDPRYTAVLVGNYNVDNVIAGLKKESIVTKTKAGFLSVRTENEKTCALSDPLAVDVQAGRIVISSLIDMPVLQSRLAKNAKAELDLTDWHAFREGKLFAFGVMDPSKTSSGLANPFIKQMLKKAEQEPMEAIYMGGVVNMLPPQGVKFLVDVKAKDDAWPTSAAAQFAKWQQEYKSKIDTKMPTLSGLQEYLSVTADGQTLHAVAVADAKLVEDLKKIPGEAMGLMFGGFGSGKMAGGDKGRAEQLREAKDLNTFYPTASFAQIPKFVAGKFGAAAPDAISGPIGFSVDQILIADGKPGVLEISVKAKGEEFVNITSESMHINKTSSPLKFFVTSVLDASGNELMIEENCGSDRNHYSAEMRAQGTTKWDKDNNTIKIINADGEKKVRLIAGTKYTDVAKINGHVSVEIATATATKKVMSPLDGKVIETADARMFLKSSPASDLAYDISGKMHHFLDVRMLNSKGQYLNSSSSSASGDEVKSVTKYVDGTIGGVEVVYATATQTKDYPFEINGITPKFSKLWGNPTANTVKASSKLKFATAHTAPSYKAFQCRGKATAVAGPFIMCTDKFASKWGQKIGGNFDVYAPESDSLKSNLSGVELFVDEVVMRNGKRYPFKEGVTVSGFNHERDKENSTFLRATYVGLYKDDKKGEFAEANVASVKGYIKVKLPSKIYRLPLDAHAIGQKKRNKFGIVAEFKGYKGQGTAIIGLQGPI
jgi:hypothetical protein